MEIITTVLISATVLAFITSVSARHYFEIVDDYVNDLMESTKKFTRDVLKTIEKCRGDNE